MIIGNYTADVSVGETAPSPISPEPWCRKDTIRGGRVVDGAPLLRRARAARRVLGCEAEVTHAQDGRQKGEDALHLSAARGERVRPPK